MQSATVNADHGGHGFPFAREPAIGEAVGWSDGLNGDQGLRIVLLNHCLHAVNMAKPMADCFDVSQRFFDCE